MTDINEKHNKYKKYLVFFGIYALLFFLCINLTHITDDWHFFFIFEDFAPNGNERRINSLTDIFLSMKRFYDVSGGRVLAHSVLQFVLMFDKVVFNIINSAMFVILGVLIAKLSFGSKIISYKKYLAVYIILLIALPSFGDTCVWESGAVNYLWMMNITLGYVYCLKCITRENIIIEKKSKTKYAALLFLLGFLAGLTNETSCGMLMVFFFFKSIFTRKKPNFVEIGSLILAVCGALILLLAPGNMNRAISSDRVDAFSISTAINILYKEAIWFIEKNYYYIPIFGIAFWIINHKSFSYLSESIAWMISGFAGMIALSLSGTFIARSTFGCIIFMLISFLIAMEKTIENYSQNKLLFVQKINRLISVSLRKKINILVVGIAILFSVSYIAVNTYLFSEACKIDNEQMTLISNAAKHSDSIEVVPVVHANAGSFYPVEGSCSKSYDALWKGAYYKIKIDLKN